MPEIQEVTKHTTFIRLENKLKKSNREFCNNFIFLSIYYIHSNNSSSVSYRRDL